jgi:23S rRNA pseudouridine1911/1915/1917 synthase
MDHEIKLCILYSNTTLKEELKQWGYSANALKNSALSRSRLDKLLRPKDEISLPISLLNLGKIPAATSSLGDVILSEEKDWIALYKPPKIHCYPQDYLNTDNMLSHLRAEDKSYFWENVEHLADRGILYRLDYETSGLLLLARNKEYYEFCRNQFSEAVVEKKYLLLCSGITPMSGDLKHYLKPFGPKGALMKVVPKETADSKFAELSYTCLAQNEKYSLVEVHLRTGHRHQIRVQFAHSGFPLVGDPLYGQEEAERLMLHCQYYKIQIKDKQWSFHCSPRSDWSTILSQRNFS